MRRKAAFREMLTGTFLGKVLVLVGGTAFAQGIQIISSPILTRLYLPDDFGMLSVYISILSLFSVVASFRYEAAITLAKDETVAANLLVLSLFLVVVTSSGLSIGLELEGELFLQSIHAPALQQYLWLLPVSVFGIGIYQALSSWALRQKAYGLLARTKVNQSLSQLVIQLVFGWLSNAKIGLLLGDAFGRMSGSGSLIMMLWRTDRTAIRSVSLKGIQGVAKIYRNFPIISTGSTFINSAGLQMIPLLMSILYGPHAAGWLLLSQRVIGAPMDLVGQSIAQVFTGEGSRFVAERPQSLRDLYFKTARKLLIWGLLPIALLSLTGPWLFQIVFGDDWRGAGVYVQILGIMFLCKLIVVPLSNTLTMLEKHNWQLGWNITRLLLVIGGLVVSKHWNLTDKQAITIYSIIMAFSYAFLFLLSSMALNVHVKIHTASMLKSSQKSVSI
jgi:O-antigen/teichoic acid export membrane protein